jgi:hypothetical protein
MELPSDIRLSHPEFPNDWWTDADTKRPMMKAGISMTREGPSKSSVMIMTMTIRTRDSRLTRTRKITSRHAPSRGRSCTCARSKSTSNMEKSTIGPFRGIGGSQGWPLGLRDQGRHRTPIGKRNCPSQPATPRSPVKTRADRARRLSGGLRF